jgi:hypothetical protein
MLLEVLRESKPITLDKSVVPQMEDVYDMFKEFNNEETKKYLKNGGNSIKLERIRFNNPYDPKFKGVTVWLSSLADDNRKAEYSYVNNTITINSNSDAGRNKSTFMHVLYHELIHAVDPKLKNKKVRSSLYRKLDIKNDRDKTTDEYTKYLKDPAEFDAWSSTFINKIKDGLELLPDTDKQKAKDALKVLINALLGLLKKYPGNIGPSQELVDNFFDPYIPQLVTIKKLIFDDLSDLTNDFMTNILQFLGKPSQFKKYIQRLSTVL